MKTLETRTDLLKLLPKGLIMAELGVFVGDFSRLIIDICQPKLLYLVDMFDASPMCSGDKDGLNLVTIPNLSIYHSILRKRYEQDFSIFVVKSDTTNFLKNIRPDVLEAVYIDASHEHKDVLNDLFNSYDVIQKGYILGHDYNLEGVQKAVEIFCKATGLKIDYLTNDGCPSFLIEKK